MLRVVVLGAAAGGGVPQWNCGCQVCRGHAAKIPNCAAPRPRSRSAPTARTGIVINASPDLRQQVIATRSFTPRPVNSGIARSPA